MRFWAGLLLLCALASAQTFSFGLRAGVPLNNLLQGGGTSRYTFGPTLEIGLPLGLAFDADFLYKRVEAASAAHRWELPLMARYRFGAGRAAPFVHAGVSFNHVISGGSGTLLRHRGTHGAVLGGGWEARFGRMRLSPEIRWTHWVDRNFGVRDSAVRSSLNQAELLVGLVF